MIKKTISFIFILTLFQNVFFGQSISDEDVTFKYRRLPLNPIDTNYTTYIPSVILIYEEEDKKKMEDFQNKKSSAENEYKKDKDDYKKTSFGDKLAASLLNQDIKPKKDKVETPYIRKAFDKNILAASYIKLDGYEKNDDAEIKVTFLVHGIEWADYKTNESVAYSTGVKSYNASFSYRSPISIKVEKIDGTVIYSETVPSTSLFKSYSSSAYSSRELLDEKARPEVIVQGFEQKLVEENMKLANQFLNDKCGKSVVSRKILLYNVSSKKEDFKDYETAYLSAMEGYFLLNDNYIESIKKIQTAVLLWEAAIKDYMPIEKSQTRINNDVFLATIFNLCQAYSITNEFSKAKLLIAKAKTLDLSKKENKKLDDVKAFIDDQQERFEINQ